MDFLDRIRLRAQRRRLAALSEPPKRGICFLQHDFDIANASGALVRGDLNDALEALATNSSGTSAPSTTYAHQFWMDTTNGVWKKRNAANSAWIVLRTIDESFVLSRSSNTMLDLSDIGKMVRATAGFTQTFDAASTLGDGWHIDYLIDSGATIVFDPNSTENINGASTLTVVGPASTRIWCNGSEFRCVAIEQPASDTVAGKIEIAVQSEMETGSDTTRAVTPGRQQFHQSAAKAWVQYDSTGGILSSYNVASVTDNGAGNLSPVWATDFSSANHVVVATAEVASTPSAATTYVTQILPAGRNAGGCNIVTVRLSDFTQVDVSCVNVAAFGDQA